MQYPEGYIKNLADLRAVPLRGAIAAAADAARHGQQLRHIQAPTEVDHYQLRRVMDVYVVAARGGPERRVRAACNTSSTGSTLPEGVRVTVRGSVQAMQTSFAASASA